jgi:hypothetical protein
MIVELFLYFVINGQMQKPVKIPMPNMEQCQAAILEGNTLLTPKGMMLKHSECKERTPRNSKEK